MGRAVRPGPVGGRHGGGGPFLFGRFSIADGMFAVDRQLVRDRTYFVVEDCGRVIGCGGWSRRKSTYGGDSGNAGSSNAALSQVVNGAGGATGRAAFTSSNSTSKIKVASGGMERPPCSP